MRRMTTDKQVVKVVNEAIEDGEITIPSDLPEIESGDAGKILQVNNNEDGVEWVQAPEELPDITGNEGKVLTVGTDAETGDPVAEWADVPEELPEIQSGDAGKVLKVNEQEDGVEWATVGGGGGSENIKDCFKTVSSSKVANVSWLTETAPSTYNATSYVANNKNSLFIGEATDSNSFDTYKTNNPYRYTASYSINFANTILSGGTQPATIYFWTNKSIIFSGGGASASTATQLPSTSECLFLMGNTWFNETASTRRAINASAFIGSNLQTYNPSNNSNILYGCAMIGYYLNGNTYAMDHGTVIVGKYNKMNTDATEKLIVGYGSDNNNRANCFSTGKDASNNMFIKIGDTILTETQLQALLALLNA